LREGDVWDDIPEALVTDLAQLTKANSIEGEELQFSPLSFPLSLSLPYLSFQSKKEMNTNFPLP
jgi:hypothetical protein